MTSITLVSLESKWKSQPLGDIGEGSAMTSVSR
jgi:hypothetical protein